MVTGVETAGLVLATIPLIICALENYENAIGPTKAFFRWKGHLAIAKNQLYVHHAAFHQTLQVLLSAVAEPNDLESMIEDTTSDLWKRGYVAEDLELHLGKTYGAVMREIENIADKLLEIIRHLNITEMPKPTRKNLYSIVQGHSPDTASIDPLKRYCFREKVKFTMKRQTLKVKMNEIRQSIDGLTTFIARAERLHGDQFSGHSKTVCFLAPLESIRENACEVHEILLSRWCIAHAPHRAAILLEDRLYRRGRKIEESHRARQSNVDKAKCFALCLNDHVPQTWLSTEIRLVELPESAPNTVTVTGTGTAPISIQEPFPDPGTLEEVVEICSFLRGRTNSLFVFCFDGSRKLRAYSGDTTIDTFNDTEGLTLKQILPQVYRQIVNGDLYQLAIALTATVLQLIDTPWLDDNWSKNAIIFTKSCSKVSGHADIRYPLLLRDFEPASTKASPSTGTPSTTERTRTALLSLGIMLLEISSGNALETIRTAQDLGNRTCPDAESDFITAQRWLKEQESSGSLTFGFSTAITRCLQAWLDPRANMSEKAFCTHIQKSVIKPLEVEMQYLRYGP